MVRGRAEGREGVEHAVEAQRAEAVVEHPQGRGRGLVEEGQRRLGGIATQTSQSPLQQRVAGDALEGLAVLREEGHGVREEHRAHGVDAAVGAAHDLGRRELVEDAVEKVLGVLRVASELELGRGLEVVDLDLGDHIGLSRRGFAAQLLLAVGVHGEVHEAQRAGADDLVAEALEGVTEQPLGLRRLRDQHAGNARVALAPPGDGTSREHAPALHERARHERIAHRGALLEALGRRHEALRATSRRGGSRRPRGSTRAPAAPGGSRRAAPRAGSPPRSRGCRNQSPPWCPCHPHGAAAARRGSPAGLRARARGPGGQRPRRGSCPRGASRRGTPTR